ncbi:MAG: metal-dependent transcriptional regulator [Kiritimatiellae bacterium]|nr:metal-dependent transcriptional regulator [Kiritimatiellia bacterium]MBP5228132.1 metal-dependent transcriptional regulator [Kiritimatiellia bacterium]
MPMTMSLEDYLETIFLLVQEEGGARVRDVAERLNVTMPSVNKAISELKKRGHVTQKPYGAIVLTEAGLQCAEDIIGRHRLLKQFLMILGVPEETAESDGCKIEHFLSRETLTCIERFVGQTEANAK